MKLKFFRQERGLSQIELAAATGVPRYRIQLIEQGFAKATKIEIKAFAEVLHLDIGEEGQWGFKKI